VTTLTELRAGTDRKTALRVFDSLPAVTVEEMIGSWRGSEVPTGHPLDGVLVASGWYGKRFESSEDVHPLVMRDGSGGHWSLNPARVPFGQLARHPRIGRDPRSGALLRRGRRLVSTTKPAARLRMTEFRGVVTATMCYDALPIHDAFRRLDERALLGVMDVRGAPPYVFALERD
jgi:hypothetical protein